MLSIQAYMSDNGGARALECRPHICYGEDTIMNLQVGACKSGDGLVDRWVGDEVSSIQCRS